MQYMPPISERVEGLASWEDTTPALRHAAQDAVRASPDNPFVQAVRYCREIHCSEDNAFPEKIVVDWERAKLEAAIGLSYEQGRNMVAWFYELQQVVSDKLEGSFYCDDFILFEVRDGRRIVIASSFIDEFTFDGVLPGDQDRIKLYDRPS